MGKTLPYQEYYNAGYSFDEFAEMNDLHIYNPDGSYSTEWQFYRTEWTYYNWNTQYIRTTMEFERVETALHDRTIIDSQVQFLNNILKEAPPADIVPISQAGSSFINRIYSSNDTVIEHYIEAPSSGTVDAIDYSTGTTVKVPLNTIVDSDGKTVIEATAGRDMSGQPVNGVIGTISSALAAISIINVLGKAASSAIYNASNSFWGKDMYTIDPDYIDNLYAGDKSVKAYLVNSIFMLNPSTNEVTMLMDDRYVASIAGYLNAKGWFADNSTYEISDDFSISTEGLNSPLQGFDEVNMLIDNAWLPDSYPEYGRRKGVLAMRVYKGEYATGKFVLFGLNPGTWHYCSKDRDAVHLIAELAFYPYHIEGLTDMPAVHWKHEAVSELCENNRTERTIGGKIYQDYRYAASTAQNGIFGNIGEGQHGDANFQNNNILTDEYQSQCAIIHDTDNYDIIKDRENRACGIILFGKEVAPEKIDGVKNAVGLNQQPVIFTTNTKKNLKTDEILAMLQSTYPKLWSNSVTRGVLLDNGKIAKRTYIKVPVPRTGSAISNKPVSGDLVHQQPDATTSLDKLSEEMTKTLPSTMGKANNPTKPPNPTDTGTTSPIIPPLGLAKSMWAVYNPTENELQDFGGWMWSSDPFEQIKKLFSDPMQAIIGVHKIFVKPDNGAVRSIKVGYIDSGISSKTVDLQYSYVDCGTVNLSEYFGNVFDYSPYTTVNIYLPFVGIVQLDTADVMRSKINVEYGVDVFTGDCLATIRVEREGSNAILYSYPGNCAVRYPISSGSYMSILGTVAGTAAAIYTGSMGAFGAVKGLFGNRPTVQHGGSFTGNSGATGPKKPYLIVSRPNAELASNFNAIEGFPTNYTTNIGNCEGFIRVKECHLSGINATDDELDMIDQILKDGIIVQS